MCCLRAALLEGALDRRQAQRPEHAEGKGPRRCQAACQGSPVCHSRGSGPWCLGGRPAESCGRGAPRTHLGCLRGRGPESMSRLVGLATKRCAPCEGGAVPVLSAADANRLRNQARAARPAPLPGPGRQRACESGETCRAFRRRLAWQAARCCELNDSPARARRDHQASA
jgi:hypothetical protein